MITSPEEYYAYLSVIQSNNPPNIAILPKSEKVYNIDLETRTIDSPQFLSMEKDHASETIYFLVDRHYECVDLRDTVCIIQYVNANNEARIYPVPFYDITTYASEDKMLIPWNIGAGATIKAGTVNYAIKFFQLTPSKDAYSYCLNTKMASSKVLYGMDATNLIEEDFTPEAGVIAQLEALIQENMRKDLYWTDLYSI